MQIRTTMIVAAVFLAACGGPRSFGPPAGGGDDWAWTDLGAPNAATPSGVSNHETLVVAGGLVFLGTEDGVWMRSLDGGAGWARSGLDGRAIHALVQTAVPRRLVAAGYDPRDARAPTAWYSTTAGASWIEAAVWPLVPVGWPDAGNAFRFASLTADPFDANVVYGGLDADTVAVTTDGGATWILANGAITTGFGSPCVPYRPRAAVLLQGCELPQDVAWVGASDVDTDDRYSLSGFRYVFGYPDFTQIGGRRINAIAGVSDRDDRVLVGAEGALIELTSTDAQWSARSTTASRTIYRSDADTAISPYVYVRAIASIDGSSDVLFGGTVNGTNTALSLFETRDGGLTRQRLSAPDGLVDPRVEQAIALASNDVLVAISRLDGQGKRTSSVYRLRRS